MTKSVATKQPQTKGWSKPRLERLGKIADVAGPGTAATQGQGS
jgi:hypothetical protein